MVPVRKPGRPLSVCPHPPQQACGCGSVTPAIPRKQTCHGGSTTSVESPASLVSGPGKSAYSSVDQAAKMPLEEKVAFKVQKSWRTSSSSKQSFDWGNVERMDVNQVTIPQFLHTICQCSRPHDTTCQSIGCSAHPYNDATQEYVESAWELWDAYIPATKQYNNYQLSLNGSASTQTPSLAHTPTSSIFESDKELDLLAADFFSSNTHLQQMVVAGTPRVVPVLKIVNA